MYLSTNQMLKVTYFQNRFASDNAELKAKAAEEGRTVAATVHTEWTWAEITNMVMDRSKWSTFTAHDADAYSKAKEKFDAVVMAQMIEGGARSASNVIAHYAVVLDMKWFTEFGHLNRGDMLTSEQHRCHNEKKKFQRRV